MPNVTKVVHVLRRFVPESWGGTEAVAYHLSRESIARGIESPIHCTSMLAEPGSSMLDSVPVTRHRYRFPWIGLSGEDKRALTLKGGSPLSLALFAGLMKERDASIIHTHVQHRLGGMARTAARWKGIPYVVSLHGGHFTLPQDQIDRMMSPFAGKPEWGKIFGAMFGSRRVLADADAVICVGQAEYDAVRQRYPSKRIYLVPNGVDVQHFARAEGQTFCDTYGFKPEEKIILCVSRIDPQKNQIGLVRAFGRFAENRPLHRLVLLGPIAIEAYHREVATEIERLGLNDKVRVIGGLRPDDPLLPSAYKAAELFVLPSVYEPFGIAVLEAWAAGIPVLASRVGGVSGIATDRETALLFDPMEEEQLMEGMSELADNGSLRSALTNAAFRSVSEKYDWSAIASRTLDIYNELVRDKCQRPEREKIGIKTGENVKS